MNPQRTSLPEPEQSREPSKKSIEVSYMLELTADELERLRRALQLFRIWSTLHRPPNRPLVEGLLKKIADLLTGIES